MSVFHVQCTLRSFSVDFVGADMQLSITSALLLLMSFFLCLTSPRPVTSLILHVPVAQSPESEQGCHTLQSHVVVTCPSSMMAEVGMVHHLVFSDLQGLSCSVGQRRSTIADTEPTPVRLPSIMRHGCLAYLPTGVSVPSIPHLYCLSLLRLS